MNRLIAFGCSITYGAGLSDCIVDGGYPGPEPSQYSWPSQLGQLINKKVVNNGTPGASNFQILHNILNFNFDPTDYVFVMWSYIDRDMVFTKDGIRPLGAWQRDDLMRHWLALHDPIDRATRTWYYIHHSNLYLSSLGVKYYNYVVHLEPLMSFKPGWFNEKIYDIDVQSIKTLDLASDKMHPGPKSHKEIAVRIGKTINEN